MKIMNIKRNKDGIKETIEASNFNPFATKRKIVEWIKEWFSINAKDSVAIVDINGERNSFIVAALCVEALGKERVVGVLTPHGENINININKELIKLLNINSYEINMDNTIDSIINPLKYINKINISTQAKNNLPIKIKMSILDSIAHSINGCVVSSVNLIDTIINPIVLKEDNISVIFPIKDYNTTEVQLIGRTLNLPNYMIYNISNEGKVENILKNNVNLSYDALDSYVRTGSCENEETKIQIENIIDKAKRENCLPKTEQYISHLPNFVNNIME